MLEFLCNPLSSALICFLYPFLRGSFVIGCPLNLFVQNPLFRRKGDPDCFRRKDSRSLAARCVDILPKPFVIRIHLTETAKNLGRTGVVMLADISPQNLNLFLHVG